MRMPRRPSGSAIERASCTHPALAAAYTGLMGMGKRPPALAVIMMTPSPPPPPPPSPRDRALP
jgi:hypothetical protein